MTGVLAGLEDANGFDLQGCEYLVGTSAGAIVAARLAAGAPLRRPGGELHDVSAKADQALPDWAGRSLLALASPLASVALRAGALPGQVVRAGALRLLPASASEPIDFRDSFPPQRVRFDGRLRLAALDRGSGRRVVFGSPGAPHASVAEALAASCAVPLVFAPVVIGGREYVDGAIWSPTNADAAPAARDAQVLVLAPMASLYGGFAPPVRAAARALMLVEASALKARGAQVRLITPDRSAAVLIGRDLMEHSGLDATLAAGYAQGVGA